MYTVLKADGTIAEGMVPKLEQAFAAVEAGAVSVRICHSAALLSEGGTWIQ